MRLAAMLATIAISDLVAVACAACGLYGLSLIHHAAPWIGASLALGVVAIELGKREAASREGR
jgi:hypothetical protein